VDGCGGDTDFKATAEHTIERTDINICYGNRSTGNIWTKGLQIMNEKYLSSVS
jgi:hypothetical protein